MHIIEKLLKCSPLRCVCYVIKSKPATYKLKSIPSYKENNSHNHKHIAYTCLSCYRNYDMTNGA